VGGLLRVWEAARKAGYLRIVVKRVGEGSWEAGQVDRRVSQDMKKRRTYDACFASHEYFYISFEII